MLLDLNHINTYERNEDRHIGLQMAFDDGGIDGQTFSVVATGLSDGTLRTLVLTLIPRLDARSIYLIEEPENGIHPIAIRELYRALSSSKHSQILVATHSPVFLATAKPHELLCFKRALNGEVQIVRGDRHPALQGWEDKQPNERLTLPLMFERGVLE